MSLSDTADLRRSYSMPLEQERSSNGVNLRPSKSEDPVNKVDRYGFFIDVDSNGRVPNAETRPVTPQLTNMERVKIAGRVQKWDIMLAKWNVFKARRSSLVKKRLRKGIPDSQRSAVWLTLCNVEERIKANPGLYKRLVEESVRGKKQSSVSKKQPHRSTSNDGTHDETKAEQNNTNGFALGHSKSFKIIQETIERDIHRTFPRHCLFYSKDEDSDELEKVLTTEVNEESVEETCGSGMTELIADLELTASTEKERIPTAPRPPTPRFDPSVSSKILEGAGGQSRLRRVLKAYSTYDREIGYCQGMNFITAMFLTLVGEEQAFWMLVSVMYDETCCMRGLFMEGMKETHRSLYVAEKLIHQFLPRLAKHLDRETIHVTMFATQWLLTQYTSSFRFDLVTRVWDCFLFEGWKITYRVMLSLLQHSQAALLSMSFEEILAYFRELPERTDIGGKIVDEAVKIPLRISHITRYEREWSNKPEDKQQQDPFG